MPGATSILIRLRGLRVRFSRFLVEQRTPIVLGILAFILYLPGLWWGLPQATSATMIHGWDVDSVSGMIVLSEFHNLFIQPKPDWWVAYPLFHYLVTGVAYTPYLAYLLLTGGMSMPTGTYPYGFADPESAIAALALISRLNAALMAAGCVAIIYQTGKMVWNRTAGLLAAGAFMLLPLTFYYARTGNLDMPLMFWTSLALLLMAVSFRDGLSVRRAVWLGVFAACAVAVKDQAYALLLPGLAGLVLWRFWQAGRAAWFQINTWKAPLALAASGALSFVVAGGIFLSPGRFARHLNFVVNARELFYHFERSDGQINFGWGAFVLRPSTLQGYTQLAGDIGAVVLESLGSLAVLIAAAGFLLAWRSDRFARLLGVMAVSHLALAVLPVMHMQYRYAYPLAYILALFFGYAIARGWQGGRAARRAAAAAALISLGLLAARSADLTVQMIADSRYAVGEHLAQAFSPGDRIGYYGGYEQLPHLPAGLEPVSLSNMNADVDLLQQGCLRFVLVSSDEWSEPGMAHSWFLPPEVQYRLENGSLGYRQVLRPRRVWLFQPDIRYIPVVNPYSRLYIWGGGEQAATCK
jgi:hypothetical protein